MFALTKKISNSGHLLIEVLLASAIFALAFPALMVGLSTATDGKAQQIKRLEASSLLREAQEAVRSVREKGWTIFAQNGVFHPEQSGNSWSLVSGNENVDDFTRQVEVSDVYRDSSGTITDSTSSGTLDPSTKRVDTTVSWTNPLAASISSTNYFTRYLDNLSFVHTTEADFDAGTTEGTEVINLYGGEVVLGTSGNGDWCEPQEYIVAELDLPQEGRARAVKAIEGKAFTGTDTFFTGSFVEVDITNDETPVPTIAGSLPGYSTNDVFIDDDYAYVAVDDPFNYYNRDVIIVDLATDAIVGYFDTGSWWGAQGVYVQGNYGYATTGNYLRVFDLSSKTGSRPQIDSVRIETGFLADLFVYGRKVYVQGDYAHVALSGWSSNELRLINVSNPNNLTRGARANVNGSNGQEVFVNEAGTRAYLATNSSGSQDEFFIINTNYSASQKNSTSFNLAVLGSYDANGMNPTGVVSVPGNKAVLVGTGGEEYQVIDTSNENNPIRCGGIDVNEGIYGVAAVLEADGDAYSYALTADPTAEFKVIKGGLGGGGYNNEGSYESSTFSSSYSTAFNRIDVSDDTPVETDAQYQVAGADQVSGSCSGASFTFVGPDGTSGSFFSDDGVIPFDDDGIGYENPAQCFRYKAFFSTEDNENTPVLYDVTVNYSP